jgi:hypothetical protein
MVARRESERPTLAPGFDVEQFARDSDRRMTSVAPAAPVSSEVFKDRVFRDDIFKEEMFREASLSDASFEEEEVPTHGGFGAVEPETAPSAVRLATRPRWGPVLTNEAWARSMAGVPVVQMTNDGLKRLPLDHRAGFVISLMDGSLDLDTIVDLCGMDRDEALALVRDLYESGVVEFR